MVDSEDITLEKIKTQELSLEINTLSNTFQQNATIQDTPSETPLINAVDPNNKSKPQFKKYCSFCHKNNHSVSTCFRRLNMLKESKPQSRSPTPSFYQHFKNPSTKSHYSRYRSRSHSNPSRKSSREMRYQSRSYSRSHSRPRYNINPPHVHLHLIIIVIDLDTIDITTNTPIDHITLHEIIITLIPLVVHLNITPVLLNVPQIFLLFKDIILLIALLLNHAIIVIEADPTQIQKLIVKINTNHLLILPIHLHHPSRTTLIQKLTLKLTCITLHFHYPNLLQLHPNMLMLSPLPLGLLTYTYLNLPKIPLSLLNWNYCSYLIVEHLFVF